MNKSTNKKLRSDLPHVYYVLCQMCYHINIDPDDVDFFADYWFNDYTWTKKQKLEFSTWLIAYLQSCASARVEFMTTPRNNKQRIAEVVEEFLLYCGWGDEREND